MNAGLLLLTGFVLFWIGAYNLFSSLTNSRNIELFIAVITMVIAAGIFHKGLKLIHPLAF